MRKNKVLRVDLTGQRFGRLLVLRDTQERTPRGCTVWFCRCDCGNEHRVITPYLVAGQVKSCGCLKAERALTGNTKHGRRWDPSCRSEYFTWISLRDRCNNPRDAGYANYGGRGIRVCLEWDSFEQFYADMGPKPSPAHCIERKDNDGPYSAENCCWATRTIQARNKRNNRFITAGGETLLLTDWAARLGSDSSLILNRIRRGWSPEEAVTTPKNGHR